LIVVDASVVVDLILDRASGVRRFWGWPSAAGEPLAAPHLLDAEVGHALCRGVLRGLLPAPLALSALEDLARLRLTRHPHTALLPRAFELRDNATMYDALYLALAEILGATFITRDQSLAHVPGIAARVEVIP
jgi:predicted nucleic acid-binding protein